MEERMLETLKSLTEAARAFWEGAETCGPETLEDYFEMELVRAEDFLEEVERNADIRV